MNGAGIGGGRAGSGGTITIENNSTITALSQSGAGIGGGAGSTNQAGGSGGTILITSGDITALSQSGAGIGGGRGGDGSGSTYDNGSHGGSGGSGGSITIKNATVNAQSNTNGAGIGGGTGGNGGGSWHGFSGNGGSGGSGGTVILEDATVNAISLANGAGVGGGAGGIGGSTYYETSGTGGTGGSGGEIIIKSGNIIADGLTGIGGGAGGNGGNGISSLSGSNGGRGGNGGTGGLITINGGLITVPGISSVRINGGYGGSGGSGGYGYRGASGGNGGTGGIGGDIVITGGTIMPSGSGINSGIGGGRGGNGGNGGNASAGSSGRGPSGSAGAASVLSSCIVTGGSMNANIGCVPTTGGDTPVNVYFTVARLRDADQATIRTLSFVQDSLVDYGIQDMRTDADGRLYLYLPAYENLTTAEFSAGSMTYSGYNGLLRDSATFTDPNVLKLDQTPLVFSNLAERTFTFGDDVVLEYEVTGGTLVSGTVAYTFSGTDFSTEETFTGRLSPPANAGHYSLIATLPGDDYYHDATAVKRFFIVPKSMTGFTVGEISPITYTGAAVTPAVSVHDGSIELVSNRDFIVSCDNKNAGSQLALITGKGNYQGQLTKSFQITAKEITVELTVVPEGTTMVENDVVLTATIQGAVDNPAGTLSFKYNDTVIAQDVAITDDGSTYQATAFWNRVPAGTYTLTAEYVHAENDNYICRANGQIAGYEISKYAQPDFRFVDGEDHTIDEGTVQVTFGDPDFLLQTAGKLSSGSVIFSVESGHDVLTVNGISGEVSLLKSGTAIVRALCLSDDRYLEAGAMINMTVAKAAQTGFAFPFPSITKVYGDEPFDLNASGGQSTFDVTYTVTEGDDVVSLDDSSNTLNILKAGTAVITATRSADDRYLEAITHLSITVEPDTPQIIEPPVVSEIAVIGTLASVTLSGGESNVPGRFVWNDPETIVTSSGLYELTFNPDDTVSYVSTSVHVPVSVTSILTHPGSGIQLDFSQIELPESTLSLALSVSSIPADSPVYAIIRDLASSDPDTTTDVRAVYDLTLKDQNGQVLSVFNAPLTVRIPVSDDQSSDLLVKWYDPITDTLTDMNTRLEDDFLVFETTHFSHYAVIRSTENPADPEPMPKAGEAGSMMFVYLLSLFAFVLIIRLIAFFGNRSRHARR